MANEQQYTAVPRRKTDASDLGINKVIRVQQLSHRRSEKSEQARRDNRPQITLSQPVVQDQSQAELLAIRSNNFLGAMSSLDISETSYQHCRI